MFKDLLSGKALEMSDEIEEVWGNLTKETSVDMKLDEQKFKELLKQVSDLLNKNGKRVLVEIDFIDTQYHYYSADKGTGIAKAHIASIIQEMVSESTNSQNLFQASQRSVQKEDALNNLI